MEQFFKVKEHGSTVKIEIMAGITTFMAMAYILMVNAGVDISENDCGLIKPSAKKSDHGAIATPKTASSVSLCRDGCSSF